MTNRSFDSLVDNIYSLPYVPQEDVKVYKDVILSKFESLLKSSQSKKNVKKYSLRQNGF
jgi:hypothetical protein